jgi:NTP pyrophosphatase (non-canonical NTP hydrolase)
MNNNRCVFCNTIIPEGRHVCKTCENGAVGSTGAMKGVSIKRIGKEIHENAKAHGWWENPRTEGELLMLVTSEVAEAFEEVRNGRAMTETYYTENGKMCGVPSELADVVIRIIDMCEYYGIDLEQAILEKHAFNKTRPYKHGGKVL